MKNGLKLKICAALLVVCVATPAISFAQWGPHPGPGYGYGPQGTTAMLNGDQKGDLIGQLEKAKERDQIDFRNSPDHWDRREYHQRINAITGMINGLRSGANYPMGEVQALIATPPPRHYHHH